LDAPTRFPTERGRWPAPTSSGRSTRHRVTENGSRRSRDGGGRPTFPSATVLFVRPQETTGLAIIESAGLVRRLAVARADGTPSGPRDTFQALAYCVSKDLIYTVGWSRFRVAWCGDGGRVVGITTSRSTLSATRKRKWKSDSVGQYPCAPCSTANRVWVTISTKHVRAKRCRGVSFQKIYIFHIFHHV